MRLSPRYECESKCKFVSRVQYIPTFCPICTELDFFILFYYLEAHMGQMGLVAPDLQDHLEYLEHLLHPMGLAVQGDLKRNIYTKWFKTALKVKQRLLTIHLSSIQ